VCTSLLNLGCTKEVEGIRELIRWVLSCTSWSTVTWARWPTWEEAVWPPAWVSYCQVGDRWGYSTRSSPCCFGSQTLTLFTIYFICIGCPLSLYSGLSFAFVNFSVFSNHLFCLFIHFSFSKLCTEVHYRDILRTVWAFLFFFIFAESADNEQRFREISRAESRT
jgi:hypothetical protein